MSKPPRNCSSNSSHPAASRANARVVKRKMSKFPVKHAEHRNPPKPTKYPDNATTILAA